MGLDLSVGLELCMACTEGLPVTSGYERGAPAMLRSLLTRLATVSIT